MTTFLVTLLCCLTQALPVLAAPAAEEILRRTDLIRNPATPFSTQVRISEYQNARLVDEMVVKVRSKQAPDSGQYRTLVSFTQPLVDRGKLMLRNANEVWFFDPAARSSVRISPQQRLLGQAANGDIMTTNFALDYSVVLIGEEQISDADRQQRSSWKLLLTSRADSAGLTYSRIDYWVDRDSGGPIMGRFYAASGRLLKQAYYRNYQKVLGRLRPTEVIIVDAVDRAKVTRMAFGEYRAIEIPEEWLQRGYLPMFRGN
ncbi:MAG: outer membrane lipoprotein-sorting protein [Desulfopila sp.]